MKLPCPFCQKPELDFQPSNEFAGDPDGDWVLITAKRCPSCGWWPSFGRFQTKEEAEAWIPPVPMTETVAEAEDPAQEKKAIPMKKKVAA